MDENKEKIELIKKSFELKHANQYKEALVMLYKALEYDNYNQDNVELLSQIGELHILMGNYERALDEFHKALSINPRHTYSMQKCFEIYCATNNYQKALRIAQQMFEYDKNAVSSRYYIQALINLDKKQDALEVFNSLDETIKLDSDLLYLISTLYEGEKRYIILKRIVELDENYDRANLDLAKIEYEKGNIEATIKHCLNVDENNPTALYYLGVIETRLGNTKHAIELLLKAIKKDRGVHDYYLDLARAYIDNYSLDEALVALKKSINFSLIGEDKNNIDEKYFLAGWILIKQKEFSKAELNLSSVRENSPYYVNAQIMLQTINLKKMNLSGAKNILEKYLDKDETNVFILDSLALVYKELKLYKEAIKAFKKALSLYPDSIYYKLELIDLLIDDKKYDEALKMIVEFSEINQNCAQIYNSLTRIRYRQKDYNSALDSINRCIALDKNIAESHYFKGLILNDIGNFENAKHSIYEAIKLNPMIAKYYNQMARSYQGLGEYENALLYSKEAIELNQDEIGYKKLAYDIAVAFGDERKIRIFKSQLERSEKILKIGKV